MIIAQQVVVSISSPSSEGGGMKRLASNMVASMVSISSPSSEGGGWWNFAYMPPAPFWFPLVLLQAKVVGKNIRQLFHVLLIMKFPLVLLQAKVVGSPSGAMPQTANQPVSISSPSSEGGG